MQRPMECKSHSGSAISLGHFGGREVMTRYAVAILLALTMPVSAQDRYSANYFLPGCKGFLVHESTQLSVSEMFMAIRCVGFIEGLGYGVEGMVVCRPNEVTTGQLVAVVVKYISTSRQGQRGCTRTLVGSPLKRCRRRGLASASDFDPCGVPALMGWTKAHLPKATNSTGTRRSKCRRR